MLLCITAGAQAAPRRAPGNRRCDEGDFPSNGQTFPNADQPLQCAISIDSHPLSDANLLIGGNGFIGSPLASELRDSGHSVAIFHRSADKSPDKNVVRIQGDRKRLSDIRADSAIFA